MADRIGNRIHVYEPMGSDGRAPFSPVSEEARRAFQNIRAIILVGVRQRLMRPELGFPLEQLLDQPADEVTVRTAEALALGYLAKHEPGVEFTDVAIEVDEDGDAVDIQMNITGIVKKVGEPINAEILVEITA